MPPKELERLEKWVNGDSAYFYGGYGLPTKLRIKDGRIETSRNASISLETARNFYQKLLRKEKLLGEKLEGFPITGINGTLKIGCHDIDIEEVHRIGKQLLQV